MVARILTPAEATGIQTALNAHGAHLVEDGHFGELSHLALIRFQHEAGIVPEDGNPTLATTEALGIPPITTPAPSKPRLTPNPLVQAIGGFVINTILNQALKGTGINMDFSKVAKALAGGISGAIATTGTMAAVYLQLPPEAQTHFPSLVYSVLPWVNEAIGFLIGFSVVYFAPANKTV